MKKKYLKVALALSFLMLAMVCLTIIVCNHIVVSSTDGLHYDSIDKIQHRNVGLLLGTNKYTRRGHDNEYYLRRIEATVKLYQAGKIDTILVSGDNSSEDYNEPEMMKADLVRAGVPDSCIMLDFGGRRTLDSVIRAKDVFGKTNLLIISQEFHNQRALYVALHNDVDAMAFDAQYPIYRRSIKVKVREWFAKVKVVMDVAFNVQPHFKE